MALTANKWKILISVWLGLASYSQAQGAYPTIDTVPKQTYSGPVSFQKTKIANSGVPESCAFGDFNHDGIQDIVSGNDWFAGPGFTVKHRFRILSEIDLTFPDDFTVTMDIDKDGYDEVISGAHNFGLYCYKNPGTNKDGMWARLIIDAERPPNGKVDTVLATGGHDHNIGWHSGGLVDVDGDGIAQELLSTGVNQSSKMNMQWYKYENNAWVKHGLGAPCDAWGSGMGDLNMDGRADVICPDSWFEAPVNRVTGQWIRRPILANISVVAGDPEVPLPTNSAGFKAGHTVQIYAYDVNKDGLNDILLSSAHAKGVFWYQQSKNSKGEMTWIEHIIDRSWSHAHNLEFRDINKDGIPDLVTGKRYQGWGPGETETSGVFWYQLTPGAANPWTRHVVSFKERIGGGTKADVKDFDKDGDLDILVTSRDSAGTNLFVNMSAPVQIKGKRVSGGSVAPLLSEASMKLLGLKYDGVEFRNFQGRAVLLPKNSPLK